MILSLFHLLAVWEIILSSTNKPHKTRERLKQRVSDGTRRKHTGSWVNLVIHLDWLVVVF